MYFCTTNSKVQTTMRLFPLLIAMLLAACGGSPEVDALLAVADSLSGVKPDSALRLLQQQEAGVPHWSKAQRMRGELLRARAMNKAYVDFTTDSIIKEVADYYDRHGTANEQMEAHYLLGCVYRDLGEAPRAIEAYQDAVARADTTAQDCDYALLCRVLSQEANVFYQENLMSEYLKCLDKSIVYATYAHDTLAAINSFIYKMSAYDRLGLPDKVTTICEQTTNQLSLMGYRKLAAQFSVLGISAFLKQKQIERAKYFIDLYENLSGYFDKFHNIEAGRESFYNLKGRYFHAIMQYDSAEYYYRKELQYGMDFMNQNMASKGLALLFNETNCPDSAAKYALYAYSMNDSVYAHMATKEVEQTKGMYEYGRHQRNALVEKEKRERAYTLSYLLAAVISVFIIVAIFVFERFRLKRRATKRLLYEKAKKLMQTQEELSYLKGKLQKLTDTVCDKDATIQQQEAAIGSLSEIIARKEEELAASLSELSNNHNALFLQKRETDETKRKLTASPAYQLLQDKDRRGDKLEAEDWEAVSQLVKQTFPTFYAFVTARGNGTNTKEQQLCLLFRLYLKPRRASLLIGITPSMVTKLSKSVLKKLFNTDGACKDLAERLQMLR